MKIRTVSGAFFVAIITGFFLLRQYVKVELFNILICFLCAMGSFEVTRAIKGYLNKFGFIFAIIFGIIIIPFYSVIEIVKPNYGIIFCNFLLGVAVVFAFVYALIIKAEDPLMYSLPIAYPSLFLLCMAYCNNLNGQYGFIALLLIFVVSPCTDTFAYLVGMVYNKIRKGQAKKLCPNLSPKKTVAGVIGGVIGGGVGAILIQVIFNVQFAFDFAYIFMLAVGLVASVLTQLGDLFESFIKRKIGIKDMGKIMPGHGGVMDRIDGICFASLFIYLVFMFI